MTNPLKKSRRKFLSVLLGTVAVAGCRESELLAVAQPHLDKAKREIEAAVDASMLPLRQAFARAHQGVPEFVRAALGWWSKMKLLWDAMPGTENVRQRQYLHREFERLVFSHANLQQAVKLSVTGFVAQVTSVESRMLVDLKADLADFDGALPVAGVDEIAFGNKYREALKLAEHATQHELAAEVAQLVVTALVQKIIVRVLTRCAVSSTILGTGAATSGPTLGTSLVLAVVIDLLVGWVWNWFSDPYGDLENQLKRQLDEVQRLLTSGPNGRGGLRDELLAVAKTRAWLRQRAVTQLISER